MNNDMISALLQRLIEQESNKDSIEFGPANGRIKVYVNSGDAVGMLDRIQAMIDGRAYAEVALPQVVQRKPKDTPPDAVSGNQEKGREA